MSTITRATSLVCVPCRGTGADGHDCSVCDGDRYVMADVAAAFGADVGALEGAGHLVRCPGCGGAPCASCSGTGTVVASVTSHPGTTRLPLPRDPRGESRDVS